MPGSMELVILYVLPMAVHVEGWHEERVSFKHNSRVRMWNATIVGDWTGPHSTEKHETGRIA